MKRLNLLYLAGVLVIAMGFFASPTPGWAAYGDRLSEITAGGLNQPAKVAVDSANGDVYVTDAGNKMVKKFDKNGNYLSGFSVSGTPVGIAVTASNIFVGDSTSHCVWVFNKSGALADLYYTGTTHKIDGLGTHSVISMPNTVAVAPAGHIFVLDGDNDKGYIFSSGGGYLASFGIGGSAGSLTNIQFYNPSGIAFGTAVANSPSTGLTTQNFFVGDQGNNRVLKLSYVYNTTQLVISSTPTLPATSPTFGSKGDDWAKFLRISDLAWDNNNRLIVVDSLQQVAQQFSSNFVIQGAFNYSGGVLNQLTIPTGAAVDMTGHKLYVANNQAGSLSVYNTTDGALPTITVSNPAQGSTTTPCTINYSIVYNGTATGSSVTVKLYYAKTKDAQGNNISNPVYALFSTQTGVSVTNGSFNSSATIDLVGSYPNYMWAGTYNIYAEVYDSSMNSATYNAGNIAITLIAGKRRYTCSMQARFGTFDLPQDSDGDGISDFDEIEGTYNVAYGYAATDPLSADTDHDGLDDGVECGVKPLNQNTIFAIASSATINTNPNNADTDGGGASDGVEAAKGTNPASGGTGDDLSSAQDLVGDYFLDGTQGMCTWFDITNPSSSYAVVDLAFYNKNGGIASKVPAAYYLKPNQTVRFFPKATYGVNEGSLEIRSTASTLKADLVRYRENAINSQSFDSGGAINLWRPADRSTKLIWPNYFDGAFRWNGWAYLKNWSDTPAHVKIQFYGYASTPSQHMDWPKDVASWVWNPTAGRNDITITASGSDTYTLAPHEVVIVRPISTFGDYANGPSDLSVVGAGPSFGASYPVGHAGDPILDTYGHGYAVATSDNPTVTGNMFCDRMGANYYVPSYVNGPYYGYQTWDYSYIATPITNPTLTSYCPLMYSDMYRFKDLMYLSNPDDTNDMHATIKFYNKNGVLSLTRNFVVHPHQSQQFLTTGNYDSGDGLGAQPMLVPGNPGTTGGTTTGSITSGSNSLTVATTANGIIVGAPITIAGVTGTKKVTAINGTVVTLDSNANATVTGATVTSLLYDFGSYIVTSDIPHAQLTISQRWNPTGYNASTNFGVSFDYGFASNTVPSVSTNAYCASYLDSSELQRTNLQQTSSADKRVIGVMYLTNFSDTQTCNIAENYCDKDGNPAWTGNITSGTNALTVTSPASASTLGIRVGGQIKIAGVTGTKTITAAGTPVTNSDGTSTNVVTLDTNADATVTGAVISPVKALGPHALIQFNPNRTDVVNGAYNDAGPTTGSVSFTSLDNPFAGFFIGQEYNFTTTSIVDQFFDYAAVKTFW